MQNQFNYPLPWQSQQWLRLQKNMQNEQLAHALLFVGIAGLGKAGFVRAIASSLLCGQENSDRNGSACGQCQSCQLINAETHPDLFILQPEEKSQIIKVDQVRKAIDWLAKTSTYNGAKVVIIDSVDMMQTASANALLKTLEEPTPNTHILLLSQQPGLLPATIRSRCQQVTFPVPDPKIGQHWLAKQGYETESVAQALRSAEGAPLLALSLLQDEDNIRQTVLTGLVAFLKKQHSASALAQKWMTLSPTLVVSYLVSWVMDSIKLHQQLNKTLVNLDYADELSALTQPASAQQLFLSLDNLLKLQQLLQEHVSINKQLILEESLIRCLAALGLKE